MNRRRCLLVGPLPPPATGQAVSFEMLKREMEKKGFDTRVIDLARQSGAAASRMSIGRSVEVLRSLARYSMALLDGHRYVYITIAQSLAGFIRDFFFIWIARFAGARIVLHLKGGNYDGFYNDQSSLVKYAIRRTLRNADRILVLGEALRRMYSFDPRLEDRVVVVPNGLPIELPGNVSQPPGPGDPFRIVFLSNLILSKGYWDVLNACAIAKNRYGLNLELIIAGRVMQSSDDWHDVDPKAEEQSLRSRIVELGLDDCAEYVGPIEGEAKWALLSRSHIFVLPTAYVNEGQPVSIIEAMAFGCVVVSTPFRAIPDLVEDCLTGLMVSFGDVEAIAASFRYLMEDRQRFLAMSQAAVKKYQAEFTMKAHIDRITPEIVGNQIGEKCSGESI